MKLLKASAFSGIITIVRTLTGFVSNKFVALYLGPSGIALVGQFINFASIVTTIANGAINNGIIKYTSEYSNDEEKSKSLYSNALWVSLSFSIFVALFLITGAPYISQQILNDSQYSWSIIALGGGIILYSLNTLLISILNGRGQLKEYTIINVLGSFVSLIFTIVMVYYYNIQGALLSLALSQSIVFFITLYKIIESPWFEWQFFSQKVDKQILKNLSKFTAMAATSVACVSFSQMLVRTNIINTNGLHNAGIWQGMLRIGESHLLIVVTALSTAYLPRLSSAKGDKEIKLEILSGYKIAIPFLLVSCILIYVFRTLIITALYSKDFSSMEGLFLFQLLGNLFKVLAWMISFLMQAKAMAKTYILTEIIFASIYVLLSEFFISQYGFEMVMVAFFLTYLIYFLSMIFIFRKILFIR
ncbi:Lipid III flippase [Dyadobacter sp. CECT 9275]|uniref:Lipid III flippase n=1 Tax=Dyadobacter helix TaxID=2822344 RepID=A0A916JE77_9BACT|nr:O-antigen translocase [Dyadobacter sp. CECT 9275]CAG5006478.1 Lipid III flippase [Dyadobacter sp. CECT 9275]